MRSLSLAVILLLLRIAYGTTEIGEELRPSETPPIPDCLPGECTQKEEYLRNVCVGLCRSGTECESRISECLNVIPDGSYRSESQTKRGPISKNSYLFMKLHPVLNRAVDSNLMNVPTRYRRIGVRRGSEFLGKRSGVGEEEDEEVRRGRRLPGTELLGKRHGSEMLGKRNVEMLGKRGGDFLGKRNEFLGKRNEFLGKRNEFLGKRSNEFLGKRNGLRMWMCREGEDCLPVETKVLLQHFKVATGTEMEKPEEGCNGRRNPPDRRQARQLNSLYFLEKL